MWRLVSPTSHRGNFVRSVFTFVLAVLITALLWAVTISPPTHAAEASWDGNAIVYGSNKYNGPVTPTTVKALGLFDGVQAYTFNEKSQKPNSGSSSSSNSPPVLHVIYFANADDVKTATNAKYRTYTDNGGTYSNPSTPEDIDIISQSEAAGGTAGTTSCEVDHGVGWWICPITNFLADGMDWIYSILSGFLEVQPPQTGQDNSLYRAWSFMRNIANVAFGIVFLIIIYSQLTNFGVTNYGIKKLFPRLIIAALLVNLSYFICSIAIDISNILGYSIQEIFAGLRESLVGPEGNGYSLTSWQSVSGFILSGGTAATAGILGAAITLTDFGIGGAIFLLLPALVSALVAVVVALFIMAARQAIIIVFVILSPLAFVAYLLPNTEKLFDKWRGTFMTMLILFPAFSVIFGGSQLAGTAIIQNADSINLVILGLMVQVAPLFITPFLIQFSGGLLGKIAGLANDPKRGLIDRTKNFTKDRTDNLKARRLRDTTRPSQFLRRGAQWRDGRRRYREGMAGAAGAEADARWSNDQRFSNIDQVSRAAGDRKALGDSRSELRYQASKNIAGELQDIEVRVRSVKLQLDNAKAITDNNWDANHTPLVTQTRIQSRILKEEQTALHSTHDAEFEEFKNGSVDNIHGLNNNAAVQAMLAQSRTDTERIALNAMRSDSAKRAVNERFTQDLKDNTRQIDGVTLQNYAGGVQEVVGAQRALASAISSLESASAESVKNATTILTHGNYSDTIVRQIALGDSAGTDIIVTDDMRKAAIAKTAGGPNTDEIIELMRQIEINTTEDNLEFRQTFVDALSGNSSKPKWATAGVLAGLKQGEGAGVPGQERIDGWIASAFEANKFSEAETLVTHDKSYLKELYGAMQRNPGSFTPAARQTFREQLILAQTDTRYSGRIGDSREVINNLSAELGITAEDLRRPDQPQ